MCTSYAPHDSQCTSKPAEAFPQAACRATQQIHKRGRSEPKKSKPAAVVAVSLAYLDKTLGCGIWGTYGIGQGRGMTQISIYTIMLLFVLKWISLRTLSHCLGDLTTRCNDELGSLTDTGKVVAPAPAWLLF